MSESGEVTLKGVIPSPSSEDLNVELGYFDADLTLSSDTSANGYAVSDFPQSVFTLLVPSSGTALTFYALPASVAVDKNTDGEIVGTLKATLNCDYRYSL